MNKLVWKYAQDGVTVSAQREETHTLFDLSVLSGNFTTTKELFQNYIRERKRLPNIEIIDFVAQNCFDTSHASDILKEMKKQGLVEIEYKRKDKTRGFYVSDNNWDEDLATIIYKGGI